MSTQLVSRESDTPALNTSALPMVLLAIATAWLTAVVSLSSLGYYTAYRQLVAPLLLPPILTFVVAFAAIPTLRAWALRFDTKMLVTAQLARVGGVALSRRLRRRFTERQVGDLGRRD